MKIELPENLNEITLKQYLRYKEVFNEDDLSDYEDTLQKVSIFCNIPYRIVKKFNAKDIKETSILIDKALNTEVKFSNKFKLNNIEFGFIPNLDKITQGEYIDLLEYQKDEGTLNKLMSVLFRPIINKDSFNNYEIEPYKGSEAYSDIMLDIPFNYVQGATGFFLTLLNELQTYTQRYIQEEQKRVAMH